MASTGGNNALSAGVAAASSEAAAPVLAGWLYGSSNPEDLSADQKQTLSTILGAASTTIGASTGNAENAIAAGQAGENAVENNSFTPFVAPVVEVLAPRLIPSLVAGAAGLALAKSIEELEESPEFDQMSGTQKMAAYYTLYSMAKEQEVNKTETLPVDLSINNTGGSEIAEQGITTTELPMTEQELYDFISTTPMSDEMNASTETTAEDSSVLGLGLVHSEGAFEGGYESNPKHDVKRAGVSPQPTNPEEILATSIPISQNSDARISYDSSTGEIVVFQNHQGDKYHGYVVKWNELKQIQKNALIKAVFFKPNGKIK